MAQRIENYTTTVQNITLPKSIEIKNRQQANVKTAEGDAAPLIDNTNNFDSVFWFGDFNFRIKRERDQVEKKFNQLKSTKSSNYDELLNHDELYKILHHGKNCIQKL